MSPTDPRPTILLVDDEPMTLDILRRILQDEYRIRVAIDGERALAIAEEAGTPDLVLLDVLMPGIDGYAVCRRLKQQARTARVPVIFVTGLGAVRDEEAGFAAGAVDYIVKPFSPPIVRSRVRAHLALARQADGPGGPVHAAGAEAALVARLLDALEDFGRADETEEITQLADQVRRLHAAGEDTTPWLERLGAAARLHRPRARENSDGQGAVKEDVAAVDPEILGLCRELGRTLAEEESASEAELRRLIGLLAGTPFVHQAEKILFAARKHQIGEAQQLLTALLRDMGIKTR